MSKDLTTIDHPPVAVQSSLPDATGGPTSLNAISKLPRANRRAVGAATGICCGTINSLSLVRQRRTRQERSRNVSPVCAPPIQLADSSRRSFPVDDGSFYDIHSRVSQKDSHK